MTLIVWNKAINKDDKVLLITNPPLVYTRTRTDPNLVIRPATNPLLLKSAMNQMTHLMKPTKKALIMWSPLPSNVSNNNYAILLEECYNKEVVLLTDWDLLQDPAWLSQVNQSVVYLLTTPTIPMVLEGLIDKTLQDVIQLPDKFPNPRDASIGDHYIKDIAYKHLLLSSTGSLFGSLGLNYDDEDEDDDVADDLILILGEMSPEHRREWMTALDRYRPNNLYHIITTFEETPKEKQILDDLHAQIVVQLHTTRLTTVEDVKNMWGKVEHCSPKYTAVLIAGYFPMPSKPEMTKAWETSQRKFQPRVIMDATAFESVGLTGSGVAVTLDALGLFKVSSTKWNENNETSNEESRDDF